jgi:uncharacterized SAM-binding protein YcdF (DUF218 family)
MHHTLEKSDAIFVLGSYDTRVADRAAELYREGYGEYIIFSGGQHPLTMQLYGMPEAQMLAGIAREQGVPADKIITEDKSTNTGENIRFTYELLQKLGLHFDSFILVQKPFMERRTYATFKKQWPDVDTSIFVTSPQIAYEDYFSDERPKALVLNSMVGDMQRIREYPKLGYQIEQEIPDEVWEAWEELAAAGYDKHLI